MSEKKSVIAGRNIYKDEKGRNILFIKSKNIGYIINDKDQKQYMIYANRYPIALIAGIFAANFNIPILFCVLIAVGILGFLEYHYRFVFLTSLSQIKNFKPVTNVSIIDGLVQENNKGKNLILTILYISFGILMVINGIQQEVSPLIMVGNIIVCLVASFMGVLNLIAFIKIKS